MARHIIIDGYNVLGIRGWKPALTPQEGERWREDFLRDLIRYQHRKGHYLTVVFDAWRDPSLEHREHRSGVQVIYTRGGERADRVIQQMARQFGRDCVVVSSDLEIKATARDHGAMVLSAQEFQRKLQEGIQGAIVSRKKEASSDFGKFDDELELQRNRPDKKGNPRKLPKSQRQRLRQLKRF